MSSLTDIEKLYLEKMLKMGDGYVLDYSDVTFGEFFKRHHVDIHGGKYLTYGTSKAKKMRAFWDHEGDSLVGHILSEMLNFYEANCELNDRKVDESLLEKARGIAARLSGKVGGSKAVVAAEAFLEQEFTTPNIRKLSVDDPIASIIENRLDEARKALEAGAYLSVVMLCGSVLEAILLGRAQSEPAMFNRSSASPKSEDGKVRRFQDWTLGNFIDVASDVGVLKPDVKKFSHGLRDFRNYIHPYEQMMSGFTPDEYTAKVCFQVLKAALASVAGERQ